MPINIRKISGLDETRWRELWDAYTRFYERQPSEEITRHTWGRIMDATSPVHAIVAETTEGRVVGIANYVVHESTSRLKPICCLQDLFVEQAQQASGVGRRLIEWLIAEMKLEGWSRLYWHTRENNHRARLLYDKFSPRDGFVRYVIENDS